MVNVLLVEDNPADMRLMKDLFEDLQSSLQLSWVTNGHDALDYVYGRNDYQGSTSPDVILLDLGLPRITGYDVLKQLKENPELSKIPILIFTTSRNPLDCSQCEALGADGYISKPNSLKGYEELAEHLLHQEIPKLVKHSRRA